MTASDELRERAARKRRAAQRFEVLAKIAAYLIVILFISLLVALVIGVWKWVL